MNKIMTKERMEIVKKGGDYAVSLVELMLTETNTKGLLAINKLNKKIEIEKQVWNSEKMSLRNEIGLLGKEVKGAKNGKDKVLTATQVVRELNLEGLTTTILNRWFVSRDLGAYKRFNCEKKRTFQPNQNFMRFIAQEGYCLTGHTVDGTKIKVVYSWDMIKRIEKLYKKDILEFIENTI